MIKNTILCLLLSSQLHGQVSHKYDDIIPKYLKVKSLFESDNYIQDSIRVLVIDFLLLKKLKPSEYFIDSIQRENSESLYLHLYHLKGLNYLKEIENENEKSEWKTNVLGNPGGSITLIYIKREYRISGHLYSQ